MVAKRSLSRQGALYIIEVMPIPQAPGVLITVNVVCYLPVAVVEHHFFHQYEDN